MEYIDIYDAFENKLKEAVDRDTVLKNHEYVKVVHVWLKNKTQYLIQKRAKKTDPNPFMWATTSGSVLTNEVPLDAAIREVKEELGIIIDKPTLILKKVITSKRDTFHTICYVYYAEQSINLKDITLDLNEVKAVDYAPLSTIKTMIKQKTFWDYPYLMNDPNYFKMLESK